MRRKKKIRGSFRAALRDPCSGLSGGARNHLSAGSIEEGGSVYSPTVAGAGGVVGLRRKRGRGGRSEEGNDGEGGERGEAERRGGKVEKS